MYVADAYGGNIIMMSFKNVLYGQTDYYMETLTLCT